MKLSDMLGLTKKEGKITIDGLGVAKWKAYQSSDEKTRADEKKVANDFVPPLQWMDEKKI